MLMPVYLVRMLLGRVCVRKGVGCYGLILTALADGDGREGKEGVGLVG